MQDVKLILQQSKKNCRAIVMDQDGTVKGGDDPAYKKANVADLLQKIALAHKYPAIITASGASALRSFDQLIEFYQKNKSALPTFISIGNGTALYRFDKNGKKEIYNLGLSLDEVRKIVEVWEKVYSELGIQEKDLQLKGIETFKNFMTMDWGSYIPEDYLNVFREYEGRCFTEKIKVTVVFPAWDEIKQRELVKKMQAKLDSTLGKNKYLASRGDDTFLHITHTFKIDPKLHALQTMMKELNLTKDQVVAFGDLPLDNDRGLLVESGLIYTFTNNPKYVSENPKKPPYTLPNCESSPVASVYRAIDFLIS